MRCVALCIGSLAVMAPCPLLGIALTRSSFDREAESFMLFGGITLFALMILAIFAVADWVYAVLIMLVWFAAAIVPDLWLRRRLTSWPAIGILLGIQAAFSLAQAVVGALLVIGKSV